MAFPQPNHPCLVLCMHTPTCLPVSKACENIYSMAHLVKFNFTQPCKHTHRIGLYRITSGAKNLRHGEAFCVQWSLCELEVHTHAHTVGSSLQSHPPCPQLSPRQHHMPYTVSCSAPDWATGGRWGQQASAFSTESVHICTYVQVQ